MMDNKQRRRIEPDAIEHKAQEVLSLLENKTDGKLLSDDDSKEIIQQIAALSSTGDFDQETYYAILCKKIAENESRKKNVQLYRAVASGAAAVILILIASILWFSQGNERIDNTLVNAEKLLQEKENVLLTLSDGSVVDLTEKKKTSVSLQDSIFKEKTVSGQEQMMAQAEQTHFNTLKVPKTKDFRLELPDGTVVMVNSDSRIKFPDKFSGTERLIVLEEGEAFFEVAKNEAKPFIVEVKNSRIVVMGTSFNVNAYPESNVKTTLVTGKVKIGSPDVAQEIILAPGQQAELKQEAFSISKVDVAPYIAWTKGEFVFNNLDLKGIMTQLNRWYNIDVTFLDSETEAYTFTGVINKKYSKEHIFSIIEKTTQIKIELKNENNVYISRN